MAARRKRKERTFAAALAATQERVDSASVGRMMYELREAITSVPLRTLTGNRPRPTVEYAAWLALGTRRGKAGLARLRCTYECLVIMQEVMVGSCVAAAVVSTWLVRPLKRLDNRSPAEAIRAGNLEAVRKVIHAYAHRMYSGGKRITEIPHRPRKHPATGSNIADEDIRTTSANPV